MNNHINTMHSVLHIRMLSIVLAASLILVTSDHAYAHQSNEAKNIDLVMNLEESTSQKGLINLEIMNLPLSTALQILAREANVGISYNSDIIPDKNVNLKISNAAVHEVLYELLEGTDLEPVLPPTRDVIVIKEREAETVDEILQQTVSGHITDVETGQALPGVNVMVQGTTRGVSTDLDGNYSLNIQDADEMLVVSFLGYITQQIPIEGRTTIDIQLMTDVQLLDDIVVTGYSAQARGDITGSIAIVDMDAMRTNPSGSAEQALQGQAAGVNVITSGSPGASSNVFIRGISNFGDTDPLVLVDGVEGNLNDIHPNDIESVQVLKDAGSASIYGVRGSNGVIIVTTRRGQTGAPIVTFESSVGIEYPLPGNPFDVMMPEDQMNVMLSIQPNHPVYGNGMPDYLWFGPTGGGVAFEGDPEVDPSLYHFDPVNAANSYMIAKANKEGTNWFQETFDPAPVTNQNLSVSGGSETARYFIGLGYLDQQGTLLNTHLKRHSVRVNTDFQVSNNFRIGQNLNVYHKDNPLPRALSRGIGGMFRVPTILPTHDIQGNYAGPRFGGGIAAQGSAYADRDRAANDRADSWNGIGNVYAELDLLEKFTARTSIGGDFAATHQHIFDYTRYEQAEGFTSPNSFSESSSYGLGTTWTNTLEFADMLADYHNVTVLVGSEAIRNAGRSLTGSRQEYFSDNPDYTTLSTGTSNVTNASSAFEETMFSLFADLKYAFDNRYLFGATIRRDGSSRFGEESRYGIFPSVSFGWRISNENFMSGIDWLDDLRFRGSYGILGSQNNVNPQNQFDLYGGGFGNAYYPIGGGPGLAQGFINQRIGNPQTGWEENKILNIGFDLSIFARLNLSVEYYKKSIDGLLFPQELPAIIGGAQVPTVNIGDIENRGVDISTSYLGNVGDEFQFSIGANITTYQNTVIDVPDPGYFDTSNTQNIGRVVRNQVGHPVSSFFGYEVIGLFQSDQDVADSPTQSGAEPGHFKYRDVNGDGQISPDDRTFLGDPNPDFTYGLNLSFNYKNFDLATNLYGSQGADVLNVVRSYTDFPSTYPGVNSNRLLNAWTPENTNTDIPKVSRTASFSYSNTMNSYYVEDGSYLKMRSLMLGYTLPPSFLQQFGISTFRIYARGNNLFTLTGYSGLDPEVGGSSAGFGVDHITYPSNQRAFTFGVNLSF